MPLDETHKELISALFFGDESVNHMISDFVGRLWGPLREILSGNQRKIAGFGHFWDRF